MLRVLWTSALATLVVSVVAGCKKPAPAALPKVEEGQVVQMLRQRPVPDPTTARFTIKMHSRPLNIVAPRLAGGLVVDRPDHAYLSVLDPLGSPVIELATDGRRVSFVNHHDDQFVTQDNAAASLGDVTQGALTLPDVVGMLIGLLPIDQARVTSEERTAEGLERIAFLGPGGIVVTTWVDPDTATPRRVEVDNAKKERVLDAVYAPFELVDGGLLPTRVDLLVPSAELTVNVDFRVWRPIAQAPDVFSPAPPERYTIIPFSEFVHKMGETVGDPTDGKGHDGGGAGR